MTLSCNVVNGRYLHKLTHCPVMGMLLSKPKIDTHPCHTKQFDCLSKKLLLFIKCWLSCNRYSSRCSLRNQVRSASLLRNGTSTFPAGQGSLFFVIKVEAFLEQTPVLADFIIKNYAHYNKQKIKFVKVFTCSTSIIVLFYENTHFYFKKCPSLLKTIYLKNQFWEEQRPLLQKTLLAS